MAPRRVETRLCRREYGVLNRVGLRYDRSRVGKTVGPYEGSATILDFFFYSFPIGFGLAVFVAAHVFCVVSVKAYRDCSTVVGRRFTLST